MAQSVDAPKSPPRTKACGKASGASWGHDAEVGKEKARLRSRAIEIIGKYAGDYAREAQKTKWMVDMVMKVDGEYAGELAEQRALVASLQQQLEGVQAVHAEQLAAAQQQNHQLRLKVHELEVTSYNSDFAAQTALAEHATMQAALCQAEAAASTATQECAQLAAAIRAMFEQDARARRSLAHRSHKLRLALLSTAGQLREVKQRDRADRREEELKLRQREQALLAERQLLQDQQAANTARDAELELLHLKYHATTQQMAKLQQQQAAAASALALATTAAAAMATQQQQHQLEAGAVPTARLGSTAI